AARRKHDQRNVTVISSGSNLSCALRKRLGLPYNRIKKGCSRLPAQPAPSLTRADYKWDVKLGLSITSEAVDRDSPEQKSFESEP
ncbi:MAG: hypothetical protein WAK24_04785, partial [Candidatus Acidiferrales bacterium]